MKEIPTLFVVAAALADDQGRVLLQRRSAGRAMAGLWEFPGGKVEEGERPEQALVRELAEELGIEVSASSLLPAAFASDALGNRHLVLLLYLCRLWTGEPRPLDSDGLAWLQPRDMDPSVMPPADRPLVEALERLIGRGGSGLSADRVGE